MGQKSVLNTIRASNVLSYNNLNENIFFFKQSFNFMSFIKQAFFLKKVILLNETLNFKNNKLILTGDLFFTTKALIKYKKKTKKELDLLLNLNKNIFYIFKKYFFKKFKLNIIIFNFTVLNKKVNLIFLKKFYNKLNKFSKILFDRRQSFFFDFLKLSLLFYFNKVNTSFYTYLFGQVFKVLHKKKHSKYIIFLKYFTKYFLILTENTSNKVLGFKFILNGKLKGKTRASSTNIQIGQIPIQSLDKSIQYSKTHIYTKYGVFGLRVWVYRK